MLSEMDSLLTAVMGDEKTVIYEHKHKGVVSSIPRLYKPTGESTRKKSLSYVDVSNI